MTRLCITTSGGVFLLLPLYALVSAFYSIKVNAAQVLVCQADTVSCACCSM